MNSVISLGNLMFFTVVKSRDL